MALIFRGAVRTWFWDERLDADDIPAKYTGDATYAGAEADYVRAASLVAATDGSKRLALTALANLHLLQSLRWYHGHAVSHKDHLALLREVNTLRMRFARGPKGVKKNPIRHKVDVLLDYLEGITKARLSAGLTDHADTLLRTSRDAFIKLGSWQDVAWVSLDRQWWLLYDGLIPAAASEARSMARILATRMPAFALLQEQWASRLTITHHVRAEYQRLREAGAAHLLDEVIPLMNRGELERAYSAACNSASGLDGYLDGWVDALRDYVQARPDEVFGRLFRVRGLHGVSMPLVLIPDPMSIDTGGF